MKTLRNTATAIITVLGLAEATTICVRTNGSDVSDGNGWGQAVRTVTRALQLAQAGDSVWVARGDYAERISVPDGVALYGGFSGSEASLSQRDWGANRTLLDGANSGTVVTLNGVGSATRVDGFHITRGRNANSGGGGVRISSAAAILANNFIYNNQASQGAGVYITSFRSVTQQAIVTNNFICRNLAVYGAGITIEGPGGGPTGQPTAPTIAGNLVWENSAYNHGGGIGCWKHAWPLIAGNRIFRNVAGTKMDSAAGGMGGGIYATARKYDGTTDTALPVCAPLIANNVVAGNNALLGGGLYFVHTGF